METAKRSAGLFWILFLLSVVMLIVFYSFAGGYASLVLPFNFTLLAKALDIM